MKVRLLAPAAAELEEAVAWYSAQAPGLAQQFLDEVRTARRRIAERPRAWHPLGNGVRRFRLGHFPYGLIYVVEGDEIIVNRPSSS
jgi:toxin ParE2